MPLSEQIEEACARAAHEANRAYCQALGDDSQVPWEDAPEWQKSSARDGVRGVFNGNGPRESHDNWLAEKARNGWGYGPKKDPEKKEHPCFVPYDELPPTQKAKDSIFVSVVRSMFAAFRVDTYAGSAERWETIKAALKWDGDRASFEAVMGPLENFTYYRMSEPKSLGSAGS